MGGPSFVGVPSSVGPGMRSAHTANRADDAPRHAAPLPPALIPSDRWSDVAQRLLTKIGGDTPVSWYRHEVAAGRLGLTEVWDDRDIVAVVCWRVEDAPEANATALRASYQIKT